MIIAPGSFPNDPEGFLANQAGHACIGVALTLVLWPVLHLVAVPFVALGYFAVWEIGVQRGRLIRDSLHDTAHVLAGSGFIAAALAWGWGPAIAIAAAEFAALMYGAWERR
jgi:hypothetical protein